LVILSLGLIYTGIKSKPDEKKEKKEENNRAGIIECWRQW